jgi:hypothetical protein
LEILGFFNDAFSFQRVLKYEIKLRFRSNSLNGNVQNYYKDKINETRKLKCTSENGKVRQHPVAASGILNEWSEL